MAGKFTLNGADTLKILVGQEGSPEHGASGGGGSFVVLSNGTSNSSLPVGVVEAVRAVEPVDKAPTDTPS